MPLYMDVHIAPGVTALDVARAHHLDLLHQHEYSCKCMTYWVDEQRENIFCLIEGPDKESVEKLHKLAHGMTPNKIIEVNSAVVESFLGRIYDPLNAVVTDDGLKVFSDSSFRILMLVKVCDKALMLQSMQEEEVIHLINTQVSIIRKCIAVYDGREAEHSGNDFICSFSSAQKAVACAVAITKEIKSSGQVPGFKIAISAGDPVVNADRLYGDTIQMASYMCSVTEDTCIMLSSEVKELVSKDLLSKKEEKILYLSPQDEKILNLLLSKLEECYHDPEFDVTDYCQQVAMSKSQLYRKTISITGVSPNILLKDFRLEKARELMKKQNYSIAQITFDTGFTSPSYFTKCFKAKYGMLPMAYIDLLKK